MILWQRFLSLFRPKTSSVDQHFDTMVDEWSNGRFEETIRAAAIHLADLRAGVRPEAPAAIPPGLYRVRLRTSDGALTNWIRATPSQASQARDVELPVRPEDDFPLTEED